jgi:hypothetical protein
VAAALFAVLPVAALLAAQRAASRFAVLEAALRIAVLQAARPIAAAPITAVLGSSLAQRSASQSALQQLRPRTTRRRIIQRRRIAVMILTRPVIDELVLCGQRTCRAVVAGEPLRLFAAEM